MLPVRPAVWVTDLSQLHGALCLSQARGLHGSPKVIEKPYSAGIPFSIHGFTPAGLLIGCTSS